jgi:hypothetical protein
MVKAMSINSPLKLTVSTFSTLFGISGLEHGMFELLQGNVAPGGLLISAIGPAQRFWLRGTETALTVIPNMAVTGCVAMLFSAAVILWSLFGLEKRHAWLPLLFLSIAQFLTGGGFAQIFLSVAISIVACRLNTPLSWWKKHISEITRKTVGAPWMVLNVAFIVLFLCSILIAIFGFPFGSTRPGLIYKLLMISSYVMIAVFILAVLSALSKQSLKG